VPAIASSAPTSSRRGSERLPADVDRRLAPHPPFILGPRSPHQPLLRGFRPIVKSRCLDPRSRGGRSTAVTL
jgi:hypothetical protein